MPKGIYARKPKMAKCHPDKKHKSLGLCNACYAASRVGVLTTPRATCHPERQHLAKGFCRECYSIKNNAERRSNPEYVMKEALYHKLHPEVKRKSENLRNRNLKVEVLSHYGKDNTLKCCWEGCEVADVDMLSLDHINNDGAEHRHNVGLSGSLFYKWIKKNNYPLEPALQTLCMNHQMKKNIM